MRQPITSRVPNFELSERDLEGVCQDGAQARADRRRRLPPRSSPGARPTGRSRSEGTARHGIEKRAPAHARRCLKRKTAGFGVPSSASKWRARRDSNTTIRLCSPTRAGLPGLGGRSIRRLGRQDRCPLRFFSPDHDVIRSIRFFDQFLGLLFGADVPPEHEIPTPDDIEHNRTCPLPCGDRPS